MKLELHFLLAVFCHSNALLIERDLILIESGESGSRKRRISEAEPAASEDPAKVAADDLPLNDALKKKWATGVMSFKDVHELAEAAMRQSAHGIARMAQIGTKGRHPENGSTRPQPNITTNAPHRLQGAQGQETHSLCPEAVRLAQLVLDWMNDQPIPRSLAATTATAPHRLLGWPGVRHSPLDPEGFEWEEYQEIGRVLHCTNNIQIDENKITSLVTRLYYHRNDRPPAGLADAWQRNYNSGNFEWYEMYTQNARRQGILSHCNCCKPRRVKNIS